jgi:hypothetical protein
MLLESLNGRHTREHQLRASTANNLFSTLSHLVFPIGPIQAARRPGEDRRRRPNLRPVIKPVVPELMILPRDHSMPKKRSYLASAID